MGFWIRNIFFAIILIGLAYTFIANQDLLLSLNGSLEQEASTETVRLKEVVPKPTPKTNTTSTAPASSTMKNHQYQQVRKPANAAAEGLSNFYAKIYGDGIGEKGPKIRNNIIFLPDPHGSLVEILQAREMEVSPYNAEQDDLKVIWWLNRDFIIKDAFRIEKNILKTAYQIGTAVSGHFPEGISSYFCYRQRTLVFISEAPEYLNKECILLKPQNTY